MGTVTKNVDSSYTKAHTLSGTDASKFDIDEDTGVITLANGTSLDFEAKDHYDVTVEIDAAKQGSTNAGVRHHGDNPGKRRERAACRSFGDGGNSTPRRRPPR